MIRERKENRRYSRASMGISMAFAVVACSLSISLAKVAAFEINVTLDPGAKFALGDWVAQQSLDVTGATRLLGDGATPSPASVRVDEHDENGQIIPPDDTRSLYQAGNTLWHSDGSFKSVPLRASLLSAKIVPPADGETEYASLRAAYAALPEDKRASLEGLVAEHSMAHSRAQIAPHLMSEAFKKETPAVKHVLVRTIPETGEKALYVGSYASHIIGWPIERGATLLKELLEWSTQPQFVYQHKWRINDLVMWDNRSCLHRGRPWDNGTYKRIMHRTTLAGDGPTVG